MKLLVARVLPLLVCSLPGMGRAEWIRIGDLGASVTQVDLMASDADHVYVAGITFDAANPFAPIGRKVFASQGGGGGGSTAVRQLRRLVDYTTTDRGGTWTKTDLGTVPLGEGFPPGPPEGGLAGGRRAGRRLRRLGVGGPRHGVGAHRPMPG